MSDKEASSKTYEEKEKRLEEILGRLDNSETPIDQLAAEAKEAAKLIMSMHETLKAAKQEITEVFTEMDRQKEALAGDGKAEK